MESCLPLQTLEDGLSEEDLIEDIDSELLVRETFKNLFPESFDGVLPVRKHKVDPPALPQQHSLLSCAVFMLHPKIVLPLI